jgi:hypothetical protein
MYRPSTKSKSNDAIALRCWSGHRGGQVHYSPAPGNGQWGVSGAHRWSLPLTAIGTPRTVDTSRSNACLCAPSAGTVLTAANDSEGSGGRRALLPVGRAVSPGWMRQQGQRVATQPVAATAGNHSGEIEGLLAPNTQVNPQHRSSGHRRIFALGLGPLASLSVPPTTPHSISSSTCQVVAAEITGGQPPSASPPLYRPSAPPPKLSSRPSAFFCLCYGQRGNSPHDVKRKPMQLRYADYLLLRASFLDLPVVTETLSDGKWPEGWCACPQSHCVQFLRKLLLQ